MFLLPILPLAFFSFFFFILSRQIHLFQISPVPPTHRHYSHPSIHYHPLGLGLLYSSLSGFPFSPTLPQSSGMCLIFIKLIMSLCTLLIFSLTLGIHLYVLTLMNSSLTGELLVWALSTLVQTLMPYI